MGLFTLGVVAAAAVAYALFTACKDDSDEDQQPGPRLPSYGATSNAHQHTDPQPHQANRPTPSYAAARATVPPPPRPAVQPTASDQPYQAAPSTQAYRTTQSPQQPHSPVQPPRSSQPPQPARSPWATPQTRPAEQAPRRNESASLLSAVKAPTQRTYAPQRRDPPSFSVPAARPALPNIIMGAPADADSEDDDDSDGSSISDIESVTQLRLQYENPQALRDLARESGDLQRVYARRSRACARRDRGLAREFTKAAKAHARKVKRYNARAAKWVYAENNKRRRSNTVDLHGLYVAEALEYAQRAIGAARESGQAKLSLIVGQGQHSENGVAKIKPALEEWLQKRGTAYKPDERNPGRLVITLDG
ncbi:hypothetical protein IEO21_06129 [Rhodonia placenta]|uniref:Smr domain-containing protein n=1 Tax=Rhodonia placenta TaxID=104341 RepID=A0A8H7P0M6_9APHY|nr:hypothetical protein IEO21_06129 [Postia placenta]